VSAREIKFRAWDGILKYMVDASKYHITLDGLASFNNDGEFYDQTDKLELMQYTGLKDKNGKEIYSGDLIKSGKTGLDYKVVWNDENAAWESLCTNPERDYCLMPYSWCDGEIIGNIYENPELLDKKSGNA